MTSFDHRRELPYIAVVAHGEPMQSYAEYSAGFTDRAPGQGQSLSEVRFFHSKLISR